MSNHICSFPYDLLTDAWYGWRNGRSKLFEKAFANEVLQSFLSSR